jgi:hypothetical protein
MFMFPSGPFAELLASCRADGEEEAEAREDDAVDPRETLRGADVATMERMQGMAEDFATWLHKKGAEQMEVGGDKAVTQLRQLSHSFNRAARAVRQIMVLKEEAAGLRPMPHARVVAANDDGPARDGGGRGASGRGAERDRNDVDDYVDAYQETVGEEMDAYLKTLLMAVEVDIAAAPPEVAEHVRGQSIACKLTKSLEDFPHPNLDATILRLQLEWLHDLYWLKPEDKPPR